MSQGIIIQHQMFDALASTEEIEMRTTLEIDNDILLVAKEIASQRGITVGKAVSELARQALTRQAAGATRNGLPQFPVQPDAGVVTLEMVNALRDETAQ
jgi:hypothetical protein